MPNSSDKFSYRRWIGAPSELYYVEIMCLVNDQDLAVFTWKRGDSCKRGVEIGAHLLDIIPWSERDLLRVV